MTHSYNLRVHAIRYLNCDGCEVRDTCVHPTTVMGAGKEEQRGVVRFLAAGGVGGREIHRRISAVNGESSMTCLRVLEWHKRFREGRVSLQDDVQHPPYSPDLPMKFSNFWRVEERHSGKSFCVRRRCIQLSKELVQYTADKLFQEWD